MAFRSFATAVLTLALLSGGLIAPVAAQPVDVAAPTISDRIGGLGALRSERNGRKITQTSRPVATPMPFSLVGFELPRGAEVSFRTSADGRRWTAWQEAQTSDDGPDAASDERDGRRLSEPIWVGEATHLQTRVSAGSKARAQTDAVGAHLVDSLGLGRSLLGRTADRLRAAWRGQPAAAHAAAQRPAIVTRSQWRADERWRKDDPAYASRVRFGVVHHTVGSNSYSRSESPAVVRAIYRYHTKSRGWDDIGYNVLVDRFGTIYEGRYGGVTRPVIGAHAGGFNTGSFGVSLMGEFSSRAPTQTTKDALAQLLAWKFEIHHIDVFGTQRYTSAGSSRYRAGQVGTIDNLGGHREVSTTACPGDVADRYMKMLRLRTADFQGPVVFAQRATPSSLAIVNGASIEGAIAISGRLRPAGQWTITVRDSAGTVVHSAVGEGDTARTEWVPAAARRGRYIYAISSPERRSAPGWITLREPTLRVNLPDQVWASSTGVLDGGARFTSALYPGARWRLEVRDGQGNVRFQQAGTETMDVTWTGSAGIGNHRWTLTADDVPPVSGTVRVLRDQVYRAGIQSDPVDVAIDASKRGFPDATARHVVIAATGRRTDALVAGPVAGAAGPVLYTPAAESDSRVLAEVWRVLALDGTVYVMGDRTIVSDAALLGVLGRWRVQRLGGRTTGAIAGAAADVVLARTSTRAAMVVGVDAWRQSIASSAYGAANAVPILLTGRRALSNDARAALVRNQVADITVVGGRTAVADAVIASIRRARPDRPVRRVTADSAAATARGVAQRMWRRNAGAAGHRWILANVAPADGWMRASAMAPLAAQRAAPLLVVNATSVPSATSRYLTSLRYTPTVLSSALALGSFRAISTALERPVSRLLQ